MTQNELKSLKTIAAKIRLGALEGVHAAASGHPGGSLSIAEILAYLYFKELNVDPKNPKDPNTYSQIITIADTSCVTSGDYERYFTVEGKKYHHIIDKDTLMPADYFSSVTIIANDSGLADCLSTALFCMSYEEGLALVEKIGGVEVLWIYSDGTMKTTQGFDALIVK